MNDDMTFGQWQQWVEENWDKPIKCSEGHEHPNVYEALMWPLCATAETKTKISTQPTDNSLLTHCLGTTRQLPSNNY